MKAVKVSPIEKLRRIWTPGSEIEETVAALEPQTELDSMVRHMLHAIVQQYGPKTVEIGSVIDPVLNIGTLRIEYVHGPGAEQNPLGCRRQASIWIDYPDSE